MRFVLFVLVLILHGCKTISENPVLLETTQNMGAMSSLQLPNDWDPIKDKYTWDELQFTYPGTHGLIQQFEEEQCVTAFHEPGDEEIKYGMLGQDKFYSCIGMIIAESGSDKERQKVFIDALLNWSSKETDPWRQIPKKPYADAGVPHWYESTSNMSVITSWYALNRNYWNLTTAQKIQIDQYLQSYFEWADFDTPTESGRIACPIGNPAGTARENVDTDTCGSVRMKGATATLALALATGHQPTYEKALTHLAVIFHQFDDEGFFIPYMAAKKQGWAFSYYYEMARFVSSWVELYQTVNVDILDYKLPSGISVADVLNTAYNITKDHTLLGKYKPDANYLYGGSQGSDWNTVKELSQEEFEESDLYAGGWNFSANDSHFALENPRVAVERLGLTAPWELGYDGYLRSDFHAFQPAHIYLASKKLQPPVEYELESFDGAYEIQWSIRNKNTGRSENVATDILELNAGVGRFMASGSGPGSAEQRAAFKVSIDRRGNIRISGSSGLFDASRPRRIRLYGSFEKGVFEANWPCCESIRATVLGKTKSQKQLEEERRQAFEKKASENRARLVATAEKLKSAAADANKAAQSGLDDLLALAKYNKSDGRWSVNSTPLSYVEFQSPQVMDDRYGNQTAKAKINGRVIVSGSSDSGVNAVVDSLPFFKRFNAITELIETDDAMFVSVLASELRPNFVVVVQLKSAIAECGRMQRSKDRIVIPVTTGNQKDIELINCYRQNFAAASEDAGNFIDGMILAAPGIADYMQTLKELE